MEEFSTRDIMQSIEEDYKSIIGRRYQLVEVNGSTWLKKGLEVIVMEVHHGVIGFFSKELQLNVDALSGCELWKSID